VRSVAGATLALAALAAQGNRMNDSSIQLWQWLRHDRSISLCRIEGIGVEPAGDDEVVRVRLATVETLWGPKAADERRSSFQRPVSPLVRLKVQIPVWGNVELRLALSCSTWPTDRRRRQRPSSPAIRRPTIPRSRPCARW